MSIRPDLPKDHERRFQASVRRDRVAIAREHGWTLEAIAAREGVTRERVRQILRKHEIDIQNESIRLLSLRQYLAEVANG